MDSTRTVATSSGVIGASFGLSAFVVAILAGLAADLPAAQILLRSVVAMIACYPIGLLVGTICQRVIQNHVEARLAANTNDGTDTSGRNLNVKKDEAPMGAS